MHYVTRILSVPLCLSLKYRQNGEVEVRVSVVARVSRFIVLYAPIVLLNVLAIPTGAHFVVL
jgi:hypothetical protein